MFQVSPRFESLPSGLMLNLPPNSAFNNILSNLGYVLLGLLFLLIVLKRDIVHNRTLVRNDLNALVREE